MMATPEPAMALSDRPVHSALDAWTGTAEALVDEVVETKYDVPPFDRTVLELCATLSGRLMRLREHPEAVALGFWMRPAAVAMMRAQLEATVSRDQRAVPRGLAFHVPPANVDTLFIYSWVLSLLMGNANIVRLSSRSTPARSHLLRAMAEVLAEPAMADHGRRNRFVLTGHDETPVRVFSAASDVRVIWGGDATVEYLRRFPTPLHGRDVLFPDRHSLAILDAERVGTLDDGGLDALADRFFDDAFWFDQAACSSPRLLVWRASGSPEVTERAVHRFRKAVVAATRRHHYTSETGMAINKMVFATDVAARYEGVRVESLANEATWVRLGSLSDYDRENCGGGLFFEFVSHDLPADLASLIGRRDQTATVFGIEREELLGLAARLNGRGIDRFVPVGRALAFDSTWDGIDLLVELSRRVVVDAGPGSVADRSSRRAP